MMNCIDCVWLLTSRIFCWMNEKEMAYCKHDIEIVMKHFPVSMRMELIAIDMLYKGEY